VKSATSAAVLVISRLLSAVAFVRNRSSQGPFHVVDGDTISAFLLRTNNASI
jgi:hypothetical protein